MTDLVRRDWCEEHNRGSLDATEGLCLDCQEAQIQRLTDTLDAERENYAATTKANQELIAERDNLKALMKRREGFILSMIWNEADKREALERELAGEREARHKLEAALTAKDKAVGVLFDRLTAAGVDCSDLIS